LTNPEVQQPETVVGPDWFPVSDVGDRPTPARFDHLDRSSLAPVARGRWRRRRSEIDDRSGRRVLDRQQLHVVTARRMDDAGRGHGERLQPGRGGHGDESGGQQYGHQHGGRHDAAPEHQHRYDDDNGTPRARTTAAAAAVVGRRRRRRRRRRPAVVVMVVVRLRLLRRVSAVLVVPVLVVVLFLLLLLLLLLMVMVVMVQMGPVARGHCSATRWRFVLAARRGWRTVVRLRQYCVLELGHHIAGAVLGAHRLEHAAAAASSNRTCPADTCVIKKTERLFFNTTVIDHYYYYYY